GPPGPPARPRLDPRPAPGRGARSGRGVLRARHRRPRQEPAPQAGAGFPCSAPRAHRLRRRLQVRRGVSGRPPWWPEGEAWPPRGRPPWARRQRGWFFGRILVFVLLLWVLSAATMGLLGALVVRGGPRFSPESLKPILEAAQTLDLLIEDLRILALSESGALALNREPVDLALLVREVLAAQAAGGVELRAELPADLPHPEADPVRLRAVLNNLIANALRHTPAGGSVTVSGRRQGTGVQVTVADTG